MKKYCLVGTGSRGIGMFGKPLVQEYAAYGTLTGLCDVNVGRLEWARWQLGGDIPGFTDFDAMLDSVPCDTVIVAVPDAWHDIYIIKALHRGKDVITEKPLTTTADKCRAILEAEAQTGRRVTVTLNARHTAHRHKIRDLIETGLLGDIYSVDFHWYLDTVHGADYFRRWHRNNRNSGGLLVHKATHHFDLVNWWVGADPREVAAMGSRRFYSAKKQPGHGKRCKECDITADCAFYLDVTTAGYSELYTDHEHHDGYFRDQCVFSDDTDIEDSMSLLVRYKNGVQMTYSLTAFAPFEGWKIAINGSKGRLEAFEPECAVVDEDQVMFSDRTRARARVNWERMEGAGGAVGTDGTDGVGGHADGERPAYDGAAVTAHQIRFYPTFGGVQTFDIPIEDGEHGGADKKMRDLLFGVTGVENGVTGSHEGAVACLIGIAANLSMSEHRIVNIDDLLSGEHPGRQGDYKSV